MMRKTFPIIVGLIFWSNLVFGQCPVEETFSYDSLEFDHSYYDAATNSIFAVGFYENSITIAGIPYFPTDTNNVGKVIVNIDTLGNVINSWQSSQFQNPVGGAVGNGGYFNPGLIVTGSSVFVPHTYYDSETRQYIYSLEKYDKGGQIIWSYLLEATENTAPRMGFDAIGLDSNGDIILTGVVQDTLIDSGSGVVYGTTNQTTAFVMAIDTVNVIANWFLPIQSSNNMELMGLATDNSGGIYVSGNSLGAESITIDATTTNYTGQGSGFIFKINVIDSDAGQINQPWINIFESPIEVEITAMKYDFLNGLLHYAAVDYASGSDDSIVDTKIGAFFNGDGVNAWEHDMIIEGWYYLAYTSWLDPNENAIYYSAWAKNGSEDFTRLKMDGAIIQDTLSSIATVQKFNTATGNSELVTPSLFSFIGDVAVLPSGNVYAQANYSGSISVETSIAKLNPSSYPFYFGLLVNQGGTTVGSASLEAFTTETLSTLSYQWYLDGTPIASGGTAKTYVPTAPGFYKVEISEENGCVFDSKSKRIFEAGGNNLSDSLALVDLYRATNPGDTTWTNADFWLSGTLDQWRGVTVNGDGRVTALDLYNSKLTGQIPNSLGGLSFLTLLNLGSNNLSGGIPPTFSELGDLVELYLEENPLGGTLNLEFNSLPNLQRLQVRNCLLTGIFPNDVLSCTELIELSVEGNSLSGTVPNVLELANFQTLAIGGNSELFFDIPDDVSVYDKLTTFSIWGTMPNGGEFPASFYQLSGLINLDLSGQQFTGSLSVDIQNLVNLEALYLRNKMSGPLPAELVNLTNLRTLDLSYNNFNSLPEGLVNSPNLIELFLQRNSFQIAELQPFASKGLEVFIYAPQRQIGEPTEELLNIGGSITVTSSIQDHAGASYQWVLNNDTIPSATALSLEVTNFSTAKAGRYDLSASHPSLPDLVLYAAPTILKIDGNQQTWHVSKDANHLPDFTSLAQAYNASSAGDTLYVYGNESFYDFISLRSPRTIIGQGYFLQENQTNTIVQQSAKIDGLSIGNLEVGDASGTQIIGIEVRGVSMQNFIQNGDRVLRNVTIRNSKTSTIFVAGNFENLTIDRSYIDQITFVGQTIPGTIEVNRVNVNITNNIIKSVVGFGADPSSEENKLETNLINNTIDSIAGTIENYSFENSLIGQNLGVNNEFINSPITDFATTLINASDSFNIDSDYVPIDESTTIGAFAGDTPYQLSGIPPVPTINNIQIGARLSAKLNVKSNNGDNIARIRYLYRKDNQSSAAFNIRGFEPTQDLEVEFFPNRSVIQPNQTYDLIFVAIDENGKSSHRTYIPYTAIAARLSGSVVDVDATAVTNGKVRVFAINPFANKYDTAAVQTLNGSNSFNFENLILGDYIILADPASNVFPDLLPTYLGNTIDWKLADTLKLELDITNVVIETEKKPSPLTEPGSVISGFFNEDYVEADSSLRALPRRAISGSGVTVRKLGSSTRELNSSLRIIEQDGNLVAFVKTGEEGGFELPNLPAGNYRLRFEYPGVETNESSDVNFNLSGELGEVVKVEAIVEDGLINVTEVSRVTSNKKDNPLTFRFYPNPAKSSLHLSLENAASSQVLSIIDLKGNIYDKISLQNGQQQIDISNLPTGIYMLQLLDENGNYMTAKLIKN